MAVYIGVDFHARMQTVRYLTTEDGEIHEIELHHKDKTAVRAFYAQFTGEVIVGFETSGYAYWFEEMLEELGHQVWVGDPAEIRRLARRRQKNDRRDADLILELLVNDGFPRLHRQTPESRLVLQQLRYRHRLVKMQTLVQNALKYMALSRGVSLSSKLTTQRGEAVMLALPFPAAELNQQRHEMVDLLRQLSAKIKPVQQWLEQQAAQDIRVRRVMTHPGIGALTGLCLVHTLLPVDRFSNPRKVSAYIGFDPVEDSSAERRRIGAISKAGSRLLRFLLIEAGQKALQDPALKHLYRRVQLRRNRPKAKVAVARHLLVRGFIMMRDEIDYAEFLRRGDAARSSRKAQ